MKLVVILSAILAVSGAASAAEWGVEKWEKHHPKASEELGTWVKNHPDAARKFFEWDASQPAKSKEFVIWTIRHPHKTLDEFMAKHSDWPVFVEINQNHRAAADDFMVWCRKHEHAAESLMDHPGALDWAGHHLYQAYWNLEKQ